MLIETSNAHLNRFGIGMSSFSPQSVASTDDSWTHVEVQPDSLGVEASPPSTSWDAASEMIWASGYRAAIRTAYGVQVGGDVAAEDRIQGIRWYVYSEPEFPTHLCCSSRQNEGEAASNGEDSLPLHPLPAWPDSACLSRTERDAPARLVNDVRNLRLGAGDATEHGAETGI